MHRVKKEFVVVVIAEAKDGLRKPPIVQENHFHIMAATMKLG